jgi:hypothetical protein
MLVKDSEEVNAQVKHLQPMLDAATMVDSALDHGDRGQDHDPDHRQSPRGDSAVASLPRISMAENEIASIGTCMTLSTTETHVTALKTGAKHGLKYR